ncbi:heavy metal translocating P-type ATPase [Paenibacillus durus]|uniref:Cd(2+)-exporting ATPase n=1 Tax=Paenibacillus durus ATCC 35681 TaxID=1333534 RepID=A0A0F7F7D0_PAEDU|nr:cation-translocating P-type ATPase [Paenibacillus durus]AKG33327.1 HAD family hydrolase [Paenibacillus durus ATCC 35681]
MFKPTKGQRILLSGILMAVSFILNKTIGYEPVTIFVMIASTVVAGTPIFKKAIGALKYRIVGIDALVIIAVTGALFIREYWEAAAVTFLFVFGDYLESRTIEKTRSSIKALFDLAPDTTRVRRSGEEMKISPEAVVKGDLVIVRPGEKISVDGMIVEGSAYINQAAITGESIPVNRGINETVFSGTIIESGYVIIKADKVGDDTTFARILKLVEEAQDKKAKTQKFLEKFSRYYTPAIIVLAALLYLFTKDLVLALTLLVISCPGALVISAPVSIVAGIGNGARHGVLVKGGEIMEKLGTIKAIAFDKTGTLTIGKPSIKRVKAYGITEDELLRLAAIGESYSEHPLAKAIINEAEEKLGSIKEEPKDVKIITGQGLMFTTGAKFYMIGNRKLLEVNGVNIEDVEGYLKSEEEKGQTAVIIGDIERVLGIISIADVVREDAKKLISNLKSHRIHKVYMLTGDNKRAAKAISDELGLDGYYAELLPEDKVRVLGDLQEKYGRTAMVGDGVNDAPALASADLGIAIGGEGTDVAMETADVVLMSAEIKKLSYAIGLSRATVRNMKQNIYFALFVAAMLLAGVLIKTVNLSFGMLIHEVSVLLVIINAVRLLGYSEKGQVR